MKTDMLWYHVSILLNDYVNKYWAIEDRKEAATVAIHTHKLPKQLWAYDVFYKACEKAKVSLKDEVLLKKKYFD